MKDACVECAHEAKLLLVLFYVEEKTIARALHSMHIENWRHLVPAIFTKFVAAGSFLFLQDFDANEDRDSIVQNSLSTYQEARYVRFYPITYTTWPCVRVEIYVRS